MKVEFGKGLQPAHCFDVLVRRLACGHGLLPCLALALGRTTGQQVATFAIAVLQLSRSRDLEPLRDAAVRLVLSGHVKPLLIVHPEPPDGGQRRLRSVGLAQK